MPLSAYEPSPTTFDEALEPDGNFRPAYEALNRSLTAAGLSRTKDALQDRITSMNVQFGEGQGTFEVDPLPRTIEAAEWAHVTAGLEQRQDALNAFLGDAYGERRLVRQGIMPARVIEESAYYEPIMAGTEAGVSARLAGPDLVRDPSGELMVLEDNVRTPSGIVYANACREAVAGLPAFPEPPMLDPAPAFRELLSALRNADPAATGDPSIVMLSDGPVSNAWFEHREISKRLDIPVIRTCDLECRRGRLFALIDGDITEVQVLYNRSSNESLREPGGQFSRLGYLLKDPLEANRLRCVNDFGAGIADDKATHRYVERMIGFYLNERPLLRSVPSLDLGDPEQRETAMARLDELVIKPRWSFGGQGIVLGPRASASELDDVRSRVEHDPSKYVAQEMIEISVHPTVIHGRFEPRHVDLRAFVMKTGDGSTTLPVALTRYAGGAGDRIVNSTRGGGAKDTWLLR